MELIGSNWVNQEIKVADKQGVKELENQGVNQLGNW